MGLSEEGDQEVYSKFQTLCADLNMDGMAAEDAWKTYVRIGRHFTLEGEPLHWLACALYVSCRKSHVPTVGTAGAIVEGNCVSLTRLLRSSKLSLIQFFKKMRNWSDMSSLPQDFRDKVDRLQKNFAVSTVIFKKFEPMFVEIFHRNAEEVPKTHSKKRRRRLCTGAELLPFCWTLFVEVKAKFPGISDDLVNSYHLLLSCIDLMFSNAVLADRRDLLKSDFPGLPANFNSKDYRPPSEPPCIIQLLCQRYDGLFLEAKVIKEHHWKPYIIRLIEQESLRGDMNSLSGLLDTGNFEANMKGINKLYESYVLHVGDFDERIFLGDSADSDIGTPAKSLFGNVEFAERSQARQNIRQHMEKTKTLKPQTPLTGQKYLMGREAIEVTPVTTATQSVSRLQALVSGHKAAPSEALDEMFSKCSRNPRDDIVNRVKEMGDQFCKCYAQPSKDHNGSHVDFAKKRLQLGESLYYKVLESMLLKEKKRLPTHFNLLALLDQDIVHRTLLACCLEIVIFSYNAQRVFPWIIEIFNIEAYDFYKVIEMIIRVEDGLSRDVVKHLNHIEECMLESLVWKSDSRLWDMIKESRCGVPSCEGVSHMDSSDSQPSSATIVPSHLIASPMQHPNVRRLTTFDKSETKDPQQSPVTPSLMDRLFSPGGTGTIGSAKRRLFTSSTGSATVTIAQPTMPQSKQTIVGATALLSPNKAVIAVPSQNDSTITFIPVDSYIISTDSTRVTMTPTASTSTPVKNNPDAAKPKRFGSLGLFFRKVYNLAAVRLQDLCTRLNVMDVELRKKMWTCLEHSIIHNTELMKDRHLDQIMLCSVYVIAKVTQSEVKFLNITRCYKFQPQATSHVYRSVLVPKSRRNSGSSEGNKNGASESSSPILMGHDEEKDKEKEEKRKERLTIRSSSTLPADHSNSQPPTPTQLAGTSNSFEFEDRGDIVTFYNKIYLPLMQKFVVKFSTAGSNTGTLCPPLSPLPTSKSHMGSPRRCVSTNHRVYTSTLCSSALSPLSCKPLVYTMSSSPAKDLRAINNMIRYSDCKIGKRILQDDSESDVPTKRRFADLSRKILRNVVTDRTAGEEAGWQSENVESGQ